MMNPQRRRTWMLLMLAVFLGLSGIAVAFNPRLSHANQMNQAPAYLEKVFNRDQITTLDIQVDPDSWEKMLSEANQENYIKADLVLNGETIDAVGIRPKGNSSLSMVPQSSQPQRYSFKIEFDHYIDGQTFYGLDKMVLNNLMADSTAMKEFLSYSLMADLGVPTPAIAYTQISVNGQPWGFYLAVEAIEDSFVERQFGSSAGEFYSVKTMEMGGEGKGDQAGEAGQQPEDFDSSQRPEGMVPPAGIDGTQIEQAQLTEQNRPVGGPNGPDGPGGMGDRGSGGSLQYVDDDPDSYSAILEQTIFKTDETDAQRLIATIKALNQPGVVLDKLLDTDEIIRYLAVQTFVVNLDSYVSNMGQNYVLREQDGQLSMLPWDYNLAFGGFNSKDASAVVNFPIDTPVSGVDLEDRPLVNLILQDNALRAQYHDVLQELVDKYLANGQLIARIDQIDKLIQSAVQADPQPFYNFATYQAAVCEFKTLIDLRIASIEGQLDGTIPSTSAGQAADPESLIDASQVDLSKLGSQGGGKAGFSGPAIPKSAS